MERFSQAFGRELGKTQRWEAFKWIAAQLIERNRPVYIGETGCARDPGNWVGDGQSTLIWDWLLQALGGTGFTVDKSPQACASVRPQVKRMGVVCDDSLAYLGHAHLVGSLDLLYLDSRDYQPPYPLSEIHHAAELAIVYEKLPSGCLIAVDDCHAQNVGKHVMMQKFFERMEISPRFVSYVTIWEKP